MIPYALLGLFVVVVFVLPRLGTISSAKARALVAGGAKLVDVRSPAEFAGGHLEGALSAPLGELEQRAESLGPKDAPIVVYCASGMRSASAKRLLQSRGFNNVHNLGGMGRW